MEERSGERGICEQPKHLGNDWEKVAYRHEKDSATPEMLLSDVAEPIV